MKLNVTETSPFPNLDDQSVLASIHRETAEMNAAPVPPVMKNMPAGLQGIIEMPEAEGGGASLHQTDINPAPAAPHIVEAPGLTPEGAPDSGSNPDPGTADPSGSAPTTPALDGAPSAPSAPEAPAEPVPAPTNYGPAPTTPAGPLPVVPSTPTPPAPGAAPAAPGAAPAAVPAPATPAPGAAPGAAPAPGTNSMESMKSLPISGPINPDQVKLAAMQALQASPQDANVQKTARDFVIYMADVSFKANQDPGAMAANGRALVQLFQDQELLSALGNPQAFARQLPLAQAMASGQSPLAQNAPQVPGAPVPGGAPAPDGAPAPAAPGGAPAAPAPAPAAPAAQVPAPAAPGGEAGEDTPPEGVEPPAAKKEDAPAAAPAAPSAEAKEAPADTDKDGAPDTEDKDADGDGTEDKKPSAPPFVKKEESALLGTVGGMRLYASSDSRESAALTWDWFNSQPPEAQAEYLRLHPMSVFNHPELNPLNAR